MTSNKKSTKYFSQRQEKEVAKIINGKCTANSGATSFFKGDVISEDFLVEAKTLITCRKSFTIKKEWLDKLKEEKFAMKKEYSALAFNFGPNEKNYFILNENDFKSLLRELADLKEEIKDLQAGDDL